MNVILTQPVDIALRTLGDDDRRTVSAWLDHLRNWENDDFVRNHSKKLDTMDNVYVLRTSTDIRIFFKLDAHGIEVLDIARKAAIVSSGDLAEHRR